MLAEDVVTKLEEALPDSDLAVSRIEVSMSADQNGDDMLWFRVILSGDVPKTASPQLGTRLSRISSALRERAARLELPLFALVTFAHESEVPAHSRKSA